MGYSVQDGVPVIFDQDHKLIAVGRPEETDVVGQVRRGDLRVEDHGKDVESAERSVCSARGDKVLILHARVDDDGNPTGNRQERRLGKRLLRRQK